VSDSFSRRPNLLTSGQSVKVMGVSTSLRFSILSEICFYRLKKLHVDKNCSLYKCHDSLFNNDIDNLNSLLLNLQQGLCQYEKHL
jgi:hypothetical protein